MNNKNSVAIVGHLFFNVNHRHSIVYMYTIIVYLYILAIKMGIIYRFLQNTRKISNLINLSGALRKNYNFFFFRFGG